MSMPEHMKGRPLKDNTASSVNADSTACALPTAVPAPSATRSKPVNFWLEKSHAQPRSQPHSITTKRDRGKATKSSKKFRLRPTPRRQATASESSAGTGLISYTTRSTSSSEVAAVRQSALGTGISTTMDKQKQQGKGTVIKGRQGMQTTYFAGDGAGGVFLDEKAMERKKRLFGVADGVGAR